MGGVSPAIYKCDIFLQRTKEWTEYVRKKKTGSHLNLSPSGMKHFMNHVDTVESDPTVHSLSDRQQSFVCACMSGGSLFCTSAHVCGVCAFMCGQRFHTVAMFSFIPENRFCCNVTAKT